MDIISSDNVGQFYRYVNNNLGNTKTVHPTKIDATKNNLTDNPAEQANICNDYFGSVLTVDNGITPQVNYIPISLTCICCRVMERIIKTHLIDYLLRKKLISKHQHGFLVKYSTCTNLTVNDWTIGLDNHLKPYAIYIDFQKAFDFLSLYLILNYLPKSVLII